MKSWINAGGEEPLGSSQLDRSRPVLESHAPANVEEKLVSGIFDEYMKLFVDRPQKAKSGVRSKVKKFMDTFGRSYIGLITAKQVEDRFRQLPGFKVYAN